MQMMPMINWVHRVASEARSAGQSVREIADIQVLLAVAPGPVHTGSKRRESAAEQAGVALPFNAPNFVQVPRNRHCVSQQTRAQNVAVSELMRSSCRVEPNVANVLGRSFMLDRVRLCVVSGHYIRSGNVRRQNRVPRQQPSRASAVSSCNIGHRASWPGAIEQAAASPRSSKPTPNPTPESVLWWPKAIRYAATVSPAVASDAIGQSTQRDL